MRMSEGNVGVTDLLMRAVLSVQGAYGTMVERIHSEHGISTVQYALIVALVALVVALIIGFFGSGVKGLFGSPHSCVRGLTTTACHVRPRTRAIVANGS
jgi:Flp pilus assembly pilin Flp